MRLLVLASLVLLAGCAPLDSKHEVVDAFRSFVRSYTKQSSVSCLECRAAVGTIRDLAAAGTPLEEIETLAIDVCKTEHMFTDDVCEEMVYLSGGEVVYVLNVTKYNVDTICNFFFDVCNGTIDPWSLEIPGDKPPPSHPVPVEGPSSFRVLHLSDTHYDPQYKEGTPTVCTHPLCCRPWEDPNDNQTYLAGPWGAESGSCDPPISVLEAALQAAVDLKPDMIYMTGDLPPHDVWMQSHDSIRATVNDSSSIIRKYFPDTPIAYSLGNHEAAPVNSYAVPAAYPDGYNMDWLYELLVPVWGQAGVPSDVMDTVRKGGYYHWSPTPGLRIVSLNSNYGFWQNWFLMVDDVDPTGQLAWLTDVLLQAEKDGEKVHILHHIAPSSLLDSFSHVYNQLITRFESTITGIFCGHSHKDELKIQWDVEDDTRAVVATYVAPSLNSDGVKSPSFRMYHIDGGYQNATWGLLDHMTYSLNLTLSNSGNYSGFPMAYSAKKAYNLPSLGAQDWADAVWEMATDDELFDEYLRHYHSFWADPPDLATCGSSCRKSTLCSIYSGDATDREPCHRIEAQVP